MLVVSGVADGVEDVVTGVVDVGGSVDEVVTGSTVEDTDSVVEVGVEVTPVLRFGLTCLFGGIIPWSPCAGCATAATSDVMRKMASARSASLGDCLMLGRFASMRFDE